MANKMNKKGYYSSGFAMFNIVFFIMIAGVVCLLVGVIYSETGIDCNFRSNSILKSVNGVEDIDTGLFSGGTINEKTLLFKDGLVASFKTHQLKGVELVINNRYRIDKCQNNGGRTWYEIKQVNTIQKIDALVSKGDGQ